MSLSSFALADAMLAQAEGCFACRDVEVEKVGPSYKEIAVKYKGNADAPAMLLEKVKAGGTGTWGQIPMPPNAHVPEADLKTLVDWILTI